jgi:hypothetical protein
VSRGEKGTEKPTKKNNESHNGEVDIKVLKRSGATMQ